MNSFASGFSERVYGKLLCIYPKSFKLEFGVPMSQIFRDQLQATLATKGAAGLFLFWLRIILDLVCSSCHEHFRCHFGKRGPAMNNDQMRASRFFVFVFVALMTAVGVRISLLPKLYSGRVLISVEASPGFNHTNLANYFPIGPGELVERLHLQERFAADDGVSTPVTIQKTILKKTPFYKLIVLQTNQLYSAEPDKAIIEVTVKGRDRALTGLIANGLADIICKNYYELGSQTVEKQVAKKGRAIRGSAHLVLPGKNFRIIEHATPENVQSVSREIPLKIMYGGAASFGIAFILAFYAWCVQCGRASIGNALHIQSAQLL